MPLPIIWEEDFPEENEEILSSIWKQLPLELVDIIMKEYLFSLEDLQIACSRNDTKTIFFICKKCNLDLNKCLLLASMNGYLNLVKYMIKIGATDKLKALTIANLFGHLKIKQFLKKFID